MLDLGKGAAQNSPRVTVTPSEDVAALARLSNVQERSVYTDSGTFEQAVFPVFCQLTSFILRPLSQFPHRCRSVYATARILYLRSSVTGLSSRRWVPVL